MSKASKYQGPLFAIALVVVLVVAVGYTVISVYTDPVPTEPSGRGDQRHPNRSFRDERYSGQPHRYKKRRQVHFPVQTRLYGEDLQRCKGI